MSVQVPVGSERIAFATSNEVRSSSVVEPISVKNLAPNEILFHVGDPRSYLYRVESGSVGVYEPRLDGGHAVIDFAFPGDLLGLGFLKNQTGTARAMAETHVTCLPIASMDALVAGDPKAEVKLAQATEREFELRRTSLVEAGRGNPVERVAAFLIALSQVNKREGRDPNVIDASWQCAFVADQLVLSIDLLAHILVEFEKRGLIESCPSRCLRLKDLVTLEGLAGEPGTSLTFRDICDCRKLENLSSVNLPPKDPPLFARSVWRPSAPSRCLPHIHLKPHTSSERSRGVEDAFEHRREASPSKSAFRRFAAECSRERPATPFLSRVPRQDLSDRLA